MNNETLDYIKKTYQEDILDFMANSAWALMNINEIQKFVRIGSDLGLNFWVIIKNEYGEEFTIEIKQKYESIIKKNDHSNRRS